MAVLAPQAASAQEASRPRLEPARVAGEVFVGAYAGIGGFVIGRFASKGLATIVGVESEEAQRRIGFVGGVVGGGLATAGVVHAIGSIGDQTGDFATTYLGSGIGFVAGLGVARLVLGPEGRPKQGMSTKMRWAAANVIAFMPAIGATIAFNSTRKAQ
ncbi:MAG: hypothetical protein ACKVS7_12290 [Gemmatimonadaceae bacterium]